MYDQNSISYKANIIANDSVFGLQSMLTQQV